MSRILPYFLIIFCLTSCIKEKPDGADLTVGDRIPDFTVEVSDRTTLTGALLREGVSLIMFFTTECPDCQETLPVVQTLYNEYIGQGVKFALISREQSDDSISSYWLSQGFTMPYSAQSDRAVYELFARSRVPRVYICRDGVIKYIFTDQPANPTYEVLRTVLEEMLK